VILRYIKGTINVDLIFEKDSSGKQECTGYVDSDYGEILTNAGLRRSMYLHYPKH